MTRHGGAKGKGDAEGYTKCACCKALFLGMEVPKVTQSVARHGGAKSTKLACRKTMCLDTGVPKEKGLPNEKLIKWVPKGTEERKINKGFLC
ncbi:unnamed protein product [Prunus armeniaca]